MKESTVAVTLRRPLWVALTVSCLLAVWLSQTAAAAASSDIQALVVLDSRLHRLVEPELTAYVQAAEGRRGFRIEISAVAGIDDWKPPQVREAIVRWRASYPKLEGILFVGNVKLPSFFMPRGDVLETRLWPRYYEDLGMVAERKIAPGKVIAQAGNGRPDQQGFVVPDHDFDNLRPGPAPGAQLWAAFLPVGYEEDSRNTYENWARQLSPFFHKAIAFYQRPKRYSRSLYIVSNDLGVLERAAAVWEAVGPRDIELYSINEEGPGAFKNNPAGYVRADLGKYRTLTEFMQYARKLPWMDEGWQSPAVFLEHMKAGRRRVVCWNVHSNPELSLVSWVQARDMEDGGLIAVMLGCGVAGFRQPGSNSHVDCKTAVEKNVLVNVVYGRSAFVAATGDPFARVCDERGAALYRNLYMDRNGYLGQAHLRRLQDGYAPSPDELRQRQEILVGDPFVDGH